MNYCNRVIIANQEKEKVLLGKRSDQPEAEKWKIIGGRPNEGEEDNMTARWEVYDETGIILNALNYLFTDNLNDWTTNYFSSRVDDADLELNGDHDYEELRWFTREELEEIETQLALNHYLVLKEFFGW